VLGCRYRILKTVLCAYQYHPYLASPDELRSSRHGSQVLISRIDPLQEMSYRGSVVSRTDSYIHVSFSETFELEVGKWRLDLGYSEIGYARMKDAIGYYHLDPDVQEKTVVSADREIMLQGTHLRDILLHSFKDSTSERTTMPSNGFGIFQDDMRIHSWARRYSRPNPLVVEGDPVLTNLNSTQIQAMAMMVGDRMSLVQGVGKILFFCDQTLIVHTASRNRENSHYYRNDQALKTDFPSSPTYPRVHLHERRSRQFGGRLR